MDLVFPFLNIFLIGSKNDVSLIFLRKKFIPKSVLPKIGIFEKKKRIFCQKFNGLLKVGIFVKI